MWAIPANRACTGVLLVMAGCSLNTPLDNAGPGGEQSASGPSQSAAASTGAGGSTASSSSGAGAGNGSYASEVLADGPVGYWRLGELRGTTAADASGNQHDGTYAGAVTLGVLGAVTGDPDTAADFDGGTAFVSIGDFFDFPGDAVFTLEAWVRPKASSSSTEVICGKYDGTNPGHGYLLFIANGELHFRRWSSGIESVVTRAPALNVFTHVVAIYDGFLLRLYVNGMEATTPTPLAGPVVDHDKAFVIGATLSLPEGDDLFPGSLDEIAVYDKALIPSRIEAHYAAATQP